MTVSVATGVASGGSPLIDPPTPPPCAADGTCYPNTAGGDIIRVAGGLGLAPSLHRAVKQLADARWGTACQSRARSFRNSAGGTGRRRGAAVVAEARSAGCRARGGEKPPANNDGLPPGMPDVPLPDAETPPTAPPVTAPPTSNLDPPPALPSSLSSRGRSAPSQHAMIPNAATPRAQHVSSGDPPPSPPWVHSAAL